MPTSGVPGQQATPNAIRAMPATRASVIAMPISSAPSNNCPINDGTINNAVPVAASLTAARTSTLFIASILVLSRLDTLVRNGWKLLGLRYHVPLRFEVEGQLVDLARELEGHIVAIFDERQRGACVLADIEAFILRERDGGGVLHGILGHLLTVHGEHVGASLAQARTVRLKVEDDG